MIIIMYKYNFEVLYIMNWNISIQQ